jgi:hypothetical protein
MQGSIGPTGNRGITYWSYPIGSEYTIQPGATLNISFTGTEPKCCQDRDNLNAFFLAYATSHSTLDFVEVRKIINGVDDGASYFSPYQGHGAYIGYDLSQAAGFGTTIDEHVYDWGLQTFSMWNKSDVPVRIAGFSMFRVYGMCNLNCEEQGGCEGDGNPCGADPPCSEENEHGSHGSSGNLDSKRVDYPCNYQTGGERSYTGYNDSTFANHTIPAGSCFQWEFDFSTITGYNYMAEDVILFNFNEIKPVNDETIDPDVHLKGYINGQKFADYYLSPMTTLGLGPGYLINRNVAYDPEGPNTVKLENNSNVGVLMEDDHGINIYRIYQTQNINEPPCQTGCEVSCQTACVLGCQFCYECYVCYSCYLGCMDTCEVSCQEGCEVSCETGCEVSCETGCQVTCEGCNVGCEVSCETVCEIECEVCMYCYNCVCCQENGCEVCYLTCFVACYAGEEE